ncbi:MAG: lysoplasmalogenase [Deltaproteobacteria bacterium]|nr:lysoplasmalogenase [Deltaproteobacteria bacterium]
MITPLAGASIALTAVALAALLLFERRGLRAGVAVAKPVASTGFLALALVSGALDSAYGRAVLVGLILSFAGDVLLIPKARAAFLGGLASFLLAHVAYVVAFAGLGLDLGDLGWVAGPLAIAAAGVGWWLVPRLPRPMVGPVLAYILAVSVMLGAAFLVGGPDARVLPIRAGALLFYVSDLSVARDRFVAPGFVNRAWGLPTYYAGQVLLALSIAAQVA